MKKTSETPSETKDPEPAPGSTPKLAETPHTRDAKNTATASTEQGPRRSIFIPLVLGGLIAGAIGFAVSEANLLQMRDTNDDLRETVEAQQADIAELQDRGPAEAPAPTDLSGVEESLASLSEQLGTYDERFAELAGRIEELEARPAVTGGSEAPAVDGTLGENLSALQASLEDQQAQIAAQREEVAAQRAEIAALIENARSVEAATADAARAAAGQNALAGINAALASGEPYAAEIEALRDAGFEELPQPLTAPADTGVVTLANLQSRFPDAARDALGAARSLSAGPDEGGLGSFLRRQLGARSITPREGDDPDAILSRAEDHVRNGQVATALDELAALPEDARAAMQEWLEDAQRRTEARAAADEIAQRLTASQGNQ